MLNGKRFISSSRLSCTLVHFVKIVKLGYETPARVLRDTLLLINKINRIP
jgi:hypothetical protein